jgi:hypothetical protein
VLRYGSVFFDQSENPEDGGWASVAGEPAKRIAGPGDLAMDTIWLTNMGFSEFYKAGVGAYPHLRMDSFLKVTVAQMCNELGIIPPYQMAAQHSVVIVSEIFNRVAIIVRREFGIEIRNYSSLKDELAVKCRIPAVFSKEEFHDACKIAQQTYSTCPTKPLRGTKTVALRKNRVAHAMEVCSAPVPGDKFTLYNGSHFGPAAKRVERICQYAEPVICNVSIKSIQNDMVDLIAFGSVPSKNRRQAVMRDWVTQVELMMLAEYADVTVETAYTGTGWDSLNSRIRIDPMPMDYLSYSYGLVAENFRLAHSSDTPTRGGKVFLSAQSLWLSAIDRFWSFVMAAKLGATGLTVSGYGGGAVNVQAHPSQYEDIMRVAHSMQLTFPLWLPSAAHESDILENGGD